MSKPYIDGVPEEIQDEILAGRKIQAIKKAREHYGLGLKEAKEKVEQITSEMKAAFPESDFAHQRGGCGTALLAFCVTAGIFLYMIQD